MTIRKRIFKSNTWIVLFSLLALLMIVGIVIRLFEDTYRKALVGNTQLQENAYDVQTLINEYALDNMTTLKTEVNPLAKSLEEYDYQLYVAEGSNKLYSNLRNHQLKAEVKMEQTLLESNASVVYMWEENTIIGRRITTDSSYWDIIAIHSDAEKDKFKFNSGTFELLLLSFLIVGIGAIIIIVLISQFFTKNLVNQIMIPIQKLMDAASRIEEGNLNEPIVYEGEDEFEMVCKSFNEMQQSLKNGLEKNAAYEKARTDMVSGISHDLRTPLTSVKGYIKGLKDGVANTPEKQEQYLDIAYKKACDMDVLLQKLFYFSKLETGNMPLYLIKSDFAEFMGEFIKGNTAYYKEKNIEVSLLVQGENHYVKIDKEQISRVIANIVENSSKYRIQEKIKVTIELTGTDSNEIITITDNGGGVPEEKLPHLFEQFYRADEARNSKKDGNGLGLYIAKYIVEQHCGCISAKNCGGLSITIGLPKE